MSPSPPTHLTVEELERWHYANGNTRLAGAYATVLEDVEDRIADAEAEAYDEGYSAGSAA